MSDLNEVEKKFVDNLLKTKGSDEIFSGKFKVQVAKKGKSKESISIILLTSYRFFLIKALTNKPSVKSEQNFLELHEIISNSDTELIIKWKDHVLTFVGATSEQVTQIITIIHSSLSFNVAGVPKAHLPKFQVKPEERLKIEDDDEDPVGACGGYTRTYRTLCDLYGVNVLEDICWDIENLFPLNNVDKFDMFELGMRKEKLIVNDLRPLFLSLRYNNYFRSVNLWGDMGSNESLNILSQALETNTVIEKLVLGHVSMTKDSIVPLSKTLSTNTNLPIKYVDLSENTLEDKGLLTLVPCLMNWKNLTYLDLNKCGGSKTGMTQLLRAIESNTSTCAVLEHLNISDNKLEADGSKALISLIANTPKLVNLSIANTNFVYSEVSKPILSVQILNAAGNSTTGKGVNYQDAVKFLMNFPNVTELTLSNAGINGDVIIALFGKEMNNTSISAITSSTAYTFKEDEAEEVSTNKRLSVEISKRSSVEITKKDSKDISKSQPISEPQTFTKLARLDLNDNDFGDYGLLAVSSAMVGRSSLKVLLISRNYSKRTKDRSRAISALINLFENDNCNIENLYIAGSISGNKSSLKTDLLPFILSLMTNKKLKELHLSGNEIGNSLGLALGKLIQVNHNIHTIYWDGNFLNHYGYKMFYAGLERNTVLSCMPYPVLDVEEAIKSEKTYYIPEQLHSILLKIQQKLFKNAETQQTLLRQKVDQVETLLKEAQLKELMFKGGNFGGTPTSGSTMKQEIPTTTTTTATSSSVPPPPTPPPQPTDFKKKWDKPTRLTSNISHTTKPSGVDTIKASALFGELERFLSSDQQTTESAEDKQISARLKRLIEANKMKPAQKEPSKK